MNNKKMGYYLKTFNTKNLADLDLKQGNDLLARVIDDFKNGELTLDELSVFGSKIFHNIAKNKGEGSDLFFISLSLADLGFEIRNSASYENIPQTLKDIDIFLDKYKKS